MAIFKINKDAKLTTAEVDKLKEAFVSLEAKYQEVKTLEAQASQYFRSLYELGEQLSEIRAYREDYTMDGEEAWVGEAGYPTGFWVPSSMEC